MAEMSYLEPRNQVIQFLTRAGIFGKSRGSDREVVDILKGLMEPLQNGVALQKLEGKTHLIQYSPHCPHPYLIRMVGKGQGKLDLLPYPDSLKLSQPPFTQDIIGSGETFAEAVDAVMREHRRAYPPAET